MAKNPAGLNLLLELLTMFERSEYATQFHQTYYLQLMREIFVVMTGAQTRGGRGCMPMRAVMLLPRPACSRSASLWCMQHREMAV